MADEITSFSNPLVKRIKRLRQKKYRRQEEAFFVEGLRVVITAVEENAPVEMLVYCPDLLTSDVAWDFLNQQDQTGFSRQAVTADVFRSISSRDNPVGLGAIVKTHWTELADMTAGAEDIFVALFETSEPGNLGTILRTMDAVGARAAILVGDTVDPFHPSAVKASMGAVFSIQIGQAAGKEDLFRWATELGLQSVATTARASTIYTEAHYQLPCLLLLGNEGQGLPEPVMGASDLQVTIPMAGKASSLNLAVAAGLMLYELRRPRAGG